MGYRDSEDSSAAGQGPAREHDTSRYAERNPGSGSTENAGEAPDGGYGTRFADRPEHYIEGDPSAQRGVVHDDYRGDAGLNVRSREGGRDRLPQDVERFQGGSGYRADGRQTAPQGGMDNDYRDYQELGRASYAWSSGSEGRAGSGQHGAPPGRATHHDPDYHQWREEQMRLLDEDYRAWRKERYQKFSEDFNAWRAARNTQPSPSGVSGSPGLTAQPGNAGRGESIPNIPVPGLTDEAG